MALNIDRHIPRTQGGVYEKNMPVSTFLRDTFFPDVETFVTAKVELDYRKGAYLIAPVVAPLVNGIIMERQGYETREYEPPTIAPKRVLDPRILQKTIPGETVYSLRTPEERQEYYIQKDMQEMDDAISRREEEMVAQLLTTGQIVVRGYYGEDFSKYVENTIDYGFTQKEVLTSGAAWDQETSTKYADIERAVNAVREAGYTPTTAVLGQTAWKLLRDDADFKEKLDTRRLDLGMIAPEVRLQNGTGLVYLGDLTELGLQLWAYYAFYKDYDGTVKKFIPEDHVVILPGAIGDMRYGAITYLEPTSFNDGRYVTYEGTRIPRTLINTSNNVKEMILSSKPIPKPYDVDSWYVLDVLS
jgi:hypothetical protein